MKDNVVPFPVKKNDDPILVSVDDDKLAEFDEVQALMHCFSAVMARRAFMRLTEKQRRNVFDEVFKIYDYGREYPKEHQEDWAGILIDYIKNGPSEE